MKTVRVLQLGENDFSEIMPVSDCAEWCYEPSFSQLPERDFDVVILDREIAAQEFDFLIKFTKAYTLFLTDRLHSKENRFIRQLIARKKGNVVSPEALKKLLEEELPDYYPGSYGEKFKPFNVVVAHEFHGQVSWSGFEGVNLRGDFGNVLRQIVFWRSNFPIDGNQAIDFWLEYEKDAGIEIALEITVHYYGYGSDTIFEKVYTFSEKDLDEVVFVENKSANRRILFASLKARGQGGLTVTALHYRYSRRGKGAFIPGGKRGVTSKREEVFYYFDPGNLTPPLNVYFSGYKTMEGFEGYHLMRSFGHPFILIAEARLEGGSAYMGSEEYENMIEQILRDHMEDLGFQNSDVILSGISMGSSGALYYGCRIHPHTILVGKPLTSYGDIAENERLHRPGGFPTSLDVLHKFCGSPNGASIDRLNHKFWDVFDQTEWKGTRFAAAYMIEDDYDMRAYENLQSHLKETGVTIYGKGLHGRHNDDSPGIVRWFVSQYRKIMRENFENK